jgi:CBS domain-containing protein
MISVADLLKSKGKEVWSIDVSSSVHDALRLLAEKDIGALPILENNNLCGIFSERDFARKLAAEGAFPLDTPVLKLMTAKVITVSPKDSVEECMKLMTDHHIRHLPVMEGAKMVGLISIGDVVKSIISGQKSFINQLEDYIGGRW